MATCSFKTRYWNFDLQKDKELPCENKAQLESDKCIFHDEHFLVKEENRIKIQEINKEEILKLEIG